MDEDAFAKLFDCWQPVRIARDRRPANAQLNIFDVAIRARWRCFKSREAVDPATHRLLYAVTAWPLDWQQAVLPNLKSPDILLPVCAHNVSAGDAFYAAQRGRILWRPSLFGYQRTPGEAPPHTLSCLAHNVLAGAVQSESLRLFALGLAGSVTSAQALDDEEINRAARLIDAMLRGVQTYRSSSLRALLQDPGSRAQVNALLTGQGFVAIP
jgi:hypothetical protein